MEPNNTFANPGVRKQKISLTTKRCWSCKTEKPLSSFTRDCSTKDGMSPRCRACSSEAQRRFREKNKARNSERDVYASFEPKWCYGCAKDLDRTEFARNILTSDGLASMCRRCCSAERTARVPDEQGQYGMA